MRLAYFSPLPPVPSGIADYSAELLPYLAAHADIDLWIGADQPTVARVDGFRRVDYSRGRARLQDLQSYDALVYHLGNDALCHAAAYAVFCEFPGVVVVHDFVLHHFFRGYHVDQQGCPERYLAAAEYAHGAEGRAMAERILADPRVLREVGVHRCPLNRPVLDQATGVIVHSDFTAALVRATHPTLPMRQIPHYAKVLAPPQNPGALRARYGLPEGRVTIGAFGDFAPAKRIDVALRAVARLGRRDILFLLAGTMKPDLNDLARALGLGDIVRFVEWVDLNTLNDYLRLTDIVINLRYPSMGETSGAATRALAAGKPCIVTDHGWFAELPDDCVVKTRLGETEEDMVVDGLRTLIDDQALRERLGRNALRYMREHHDPTMVAQEYIAFLQQPDVHSDPLRNVCVDTVAREMAALGITENDQALLEGVAASIASVFDATTRS